MWDPRYLATLQASRACYLLLYLLLQYNPLITIFVYKAYNACFIFLRNFRSKHFCPSELFLTCEKNRISLHAKCPLLLSSINQNCKLEQNFPILNLIRNNAFSDSRVGIHGRTTTERNRVNGRACVPHVTRTVRNLEETCMCFTMSEDSTSLTVAMTC
jgi:hypothetical protein